MKDKNNRFDIYEYTNQGGREYNEDAVGHIVDGSHGLFIVADGLGGHALGEVASACVRDTLIKGWKASLNDREAWFSEIITTANENILTIQKEREKILKSTVAALSLDDDRAVWAHTGDSRVYYLHDNELCAVTEDHSVAYKKYKAGEITRSEIATDEDQSSLLRSLGSEDRFKPKIRVWDGEIVSGDAFLLCTDGAWEYLKDTEILTDYLKSGDAKQWTETMLVRIMGRVDSENDNLTLLAVMIR